MKNGTALLLAGGFGTRLRSVESSKPKPMVDVKGQPFLYWLVKHLATLGYGHFIFSTGYKAEVINNYPWKKSFSKVTFDFVHEGQPLGTGGAVKEVFNVIKNLDQVCVFNGDTFLDSPLLPQKLTDDDALYACLPKDVLFDAVPNIFIDTDRVLKVGDGGTLFDAGQVFVTRRAIEKYQGSPPVSLHQLLEKSFDQRRVGYSILPGTCYDIGTPERLARFAQFLSLA